MRSALLRRAMVRRMQIDKTSFGRIGLGPLHKTVRSHHSPTACRMRSVSCPALQCGARSGRTAMARRVQVAEFTLGKIEI